MSANKFKPHVYVNPEDRADAEIANGFVQHDQVGIRQIQIMPWADGWPGVLEKFRTEYISYLRNNKQGQPTTALKRRPPGGTTTTSNTMNPTEFAWFRL